jgi:hypothetical protein
LKEARAGAVRCPRQVISLFTEAIHCRNDYVAGRVVPSEWESTRAAFEDRLLALENV